MTKLEEACHALLKAWADGFAIGDEISAIRRILFASAALSEPVTPPTREHDHEPGVREVGCADCYEELREAEIMRDELLKLVPAGRMPFDGWHLSATPSPAPEPVGRTCCEATREAAAKVARELEPEATPAAQYGCLIHGRRIAAKIGVMPLPTLNVGSKT